jgi:hypothetical protein
MGASGNEAAGDMDENPKPLAEQQVQKRTREEKPFLKIKSEYLKWEQLMKFAGTFLLCLVRSFARESWTVEFPENIASFLALTYLLQWISDVVSLCFSK